VTLLVLLPAAARARIVAADPRLIVTKRLDLGVVPANARGLTRRAASTRIGGLRRTAEHRRNVGPAAAQGERRSLPLDRTRRRLGLVAENRPQPPQIADDLFVDAILHRLEEVEALFLVFDQRIALAVPAQADAFLEVIEAVEVILPLRV